MGRGTWLVVAGGLLGLPGASLAQRAAVSGSVAGPGGMVVEYATVTLCRAADSVVVKAELSDAKGRFQVEAAVGKAYRVSVVQVGYGRSWSAAFTLPATGQELPVIQLAASSQSTLGPVTVTGQRPLYEHLADRTVVHVADSPLSAGATTLEVLGRAPGVSLDAADNLSLRGRQGLLVLIDGKRSPLSGTELADYLRTLPGDQLQTIELITNPPASYDAQGGAGVIDIKFKRDQRLGTNGSVNASYGRSEYGKFTAGLSLNHRRKNLNAYGSYTFTDRRYFQRFNFDRDFLPSATPGATSGRSVQVNDQVSQQYAHAGKVGLDLTASKRTLLGASVTGLVSDIDNVADNQTDLYDKNYQLFNTYCGTTAQDISRPSGSANLNLRHLFADSATAAVLTADVDYARYHTTRLLSLYTFGYMPVQPDRLLSGDQRSNLSIGAAKVDFSKPLPHRLRLDLGAKVTQVVSNSNVAFSNTVYSTPGGVTTPQPGISGNFSFHENVNAAYASLRGARPKTSFQVGVRAEQTNTLAEEAGAAPVPRNYLQLFPNALVERTLNQRHALALTLARRIDRPIYLDVNPLRVYLDATSYRRGNPYLRPSTTYTAGLTHNYRQKFSTTLAYARTDLPLVVAVQPAPEGGLLIKNQMENLDTQHFYSLTFTGSFAVAKWWALYTENTVAYNRYVGYLIGTDLDRGRVAYSLSVNNSFTLPGDWLAELNGLYESRERVAFQDTRDRGQVAVGLQKSLWHKQGTFRLSATDIFYTTPIRATSTYTSFVESRYERLDLRVITASLAYRFGNSKVAGARKRVAGADEEIKRGIER